MDIDLIYKEARFKATTSSGAGGQHVNKVATRVQVHFDLLNSFAFAKAEKDRIISKLQSQLTRDGLIVLASQQSRSQASNKEVVFQKLIAALKNAAIPTKARKKSRIPYGVKRKRLDQKKRQSEKKQSRGLRF
ncbi:MAG: alternative ribosome rescue aminoacyl-tRNA hydrolase ArfB [Nonlabens sp.]